MKNVNMHNVRMHSAQNINNGRTFWDMKENYVK